MFVGLHVLWAQKVPEMEMSVEEGQEFMKAAQNVMRHYSVETTQKTLDAIAFMGVTTALYAPRVVAMNIRKAEEKRMKQPGGMGGNVVPMGGFVPNGSDGITG